MDKRTRKQKILQNTSFETECHDIYSPKYSPKEAKRSKIVDINAELEQFSKLSDNVEYPEVSEIIHN